MFCAPPSFPQSWTAMHKESMVESSESGRNGSRLRKERRSRERTFNEQVLDEMKEIKVQQDALLHSVASIASHVQLVSGILNSIYHPTWWQATYDAPAPGLNVCSKGDAAETAESIHHSAQPAVGMIDAGPVLEFSSMAKRIERLEALLVCNPPEKLEPSVEEVLAQLMVNRCADGNQQLGIEPDKSEVSTGEGKEPKTLDGWEPSDVMSNAAYNDPASFYDILDELAEEGAQAEQTSEVGQCVFRDTAELVGQINAEPKDDALTMLERKAGEGVWKTIVKPGKEDVVKIEMEFLTHDRDFKVELPRNTLGQIIDIDEDGDALIDFPNLGNQLKDTKCWVRACDFDKLSGLWLNCEPGEPD